MTTLASVPTEVRVSSSIRVRNFNRGSHAVSSLRQLMTSRPVSHSRIVPKSSVLCKDFSEKLVIERETFKDLDFSDGPFCIFVGPIEDAVQSDLEEMYLQAKDEYYSGRPIVVDDMFDRVEKRLRWFKSELVSKYPRCSLKRYAAYSDAEWDEPQILTLCCVWTSILLLGLAVAFTPPFLFSQGLFEPPVPVPEVDPLGVIVSHLSSTLSVDVSLLMIACALMGSSMVAAAAQSLKTVWTGGLAALRGSCPACGEEVYAFIKVDSSPQLRHSCECHVCQQPLSFQAKLEQTGGSKLWAYGRVYSLVRVEDLSPSAVQIQRLD